LFFTSQTFPEINLQRYVPKRQIQTCKSLKRHGYNRNSLEGLISLVSEKKVGDTTVFLCGICGLGYEDRKTAQECEDYCRSHHGSCSAEISAKAVYAPGAPMLPKKDGLFRNNA
jgi:hypothetical protein